jgi:hypothetical protein
MSEAESVDDEDEQEYNPNPSDNYLPCEWLPRDAIEPNDWNPNEMNDEQRNRLRLSLLDNGWTMPIVIHAEEHYIVDGEQRWTVAGHPDIQERDDLTPDDVPAGYVPVYGITITDSQAKMATIQHNRARGDVDLESMKTYLGQLNQRTDLDEISNRIGYDSEDAQRILGEIEAVEIGDDINDFGNPWVPVERHEKSAEEMEEERSESLRRAIEDADEDESAREVARNSERVNFVLTDDELREIQAVLGDEKQAQSLVNLVDIIMSERLLGAVKPDLTDEELAAAYADYDSYTDARF